MMGGGEAAHYARTNKPSWIVLLCSCLWVQAYRDNRPLTGRHTILRETSQITRYKKIKSPNKHRINHLTQMRHKERSKLKEGERPITDRGRKEPASFGVCAKSFSGFATFDQGLEKKIINGCSRDESLA